MPSGRWAPNPVVIFGLHKKRIRSGETIVAERADRRLIVDVGAATVSCKWKGITLFGSGYNLKSENACLTPWAVRHIVSVITDIFGGIRTGAPAGYVRAKVAVVFSLDTKNGQKHHSTALIIRFCGNVAGIRCLLGQEKTRSIPSSK